jgi:hypothetical protein
VGFYCGFLLDHVLPSWDYIRASAHAYACVAVVESVVGFVGGERHKSMAISDLLCS